MKAGRPGEFDLIARYFAPLSRKGSFGLLDDAALVEITPGKALAVTQDAVAAGVHFFADDDPSTIARKALRTNLSDLAAKGSVPTGFSLALGLHDAWDEAWIAGFALGLACDCEHYGLPLTGGDTFRARGGPVISITAWGEVDAADYRTRLGASPGDWLFVTGTIGDAAFGLKVRQGDPRYASVPGAEGLLARYLVPEPPVEFAPLIARHASAAMDVSDGLVGDLRKMATASGLEFELPALAVPLSAAVGELVRRVGAWDVVLGGGDDYQLLFCVPDSGKKAFLQDAASTGIAVTELCRAKAGSGDVRVLAPDGGTMFLEHGSYQHF